jgi:hypothetical protein
MSRAFTTKLEVQSVVDVGIAGDIRVRRSEMHASTRYVEVFDRKRHQTSSKAHNHTQIMSFVPDIESKMRLRACVPFA